MATPPDEPIAGISRLCTAQLTVREEPAAGRSQLPAAERLHDSATSRSRRGAPSNLAGFSRYPADVTPSGRRVAFAREPGRPDCASDDVAVPPLI